MQTNTILWNIYSFSNSAIFRENVLRVVIIYYDRENAIIAICYISSVHLIFHTHLLPIGYSVPIHIYKLQNVTIHTISKLGLMCQIGKYILLYKFI